MVVVARRVRGCCWSSTLCQLGTSGIVGEKVAVKVDDTTHCRLLGGVRHSQEVGVYGHAGRTSVVYRRTDSKTSSSSEIEAHLDWPSTVEYPCAPSPLAKQSSSSITMVLTTAVGHEDPWQAEIEQDAVNAPDWRSRTELQTDSPREDVAQASKLGKLSEGQPQWVSTSPELKVTLPIPTRPFPDEEPAQAELGKTEVEIALAATSEERKATAERRETETKEREKE